MHTHIISCFHPTFTHMYTCPLPPPSLAAWRLTLKRMGLNVGAMGWSRQDPLAETHHPAFKFPPPGSPGPMNAYRCHLTGRPSPLPSGWGLRKRRAWGSQRLAPKDRPSLSCRALNPTPWPTAPSPAKHREHLSLARAAMTSKHIHINIQTHTGPWEPSLHYVEGQAQRL